MVALWLAQHLHVHDVFVLLYLFNPVQDWWYPSLHTVHIVGFVLSFCSHLGQVEFGGILGSSVGGA